MTDIQTKLDRLTGAIAAEAAAEAMKIIKEDKARRTAAITEIEKKISEETADYVTRRISEIKLREARRVSAHSMALRRKVLSLREDCAQAVFDEARRKISEFTKSPEYEGRLIALLDRALSALSSASGEPREAELYLRASDLRFAAILQEHIPHITLTVKEGSFELGGLILTVPAQNVSVDMSFDTGMTDVKSSFIQISSFEVGQ